MMVITNLTIKKNPQAYNMKGFKSDPLVVKHK